MKNGNLLTRLSFFILGLGNLVNRQLVRGFVFLGLEAAYVYYMAAFGAQAARARQDSISRVLGITMIAPIYKVEGWERHSPPATGACGTTTASGTAA